MFKGALLATLLVSCFSSPATASHYRYGRLTWTTAGGNTIEFTIENSWRRSAYSTSNNRCRDIAAAGIPAKPCTGAGGFAGVGDVIAEFQATPSPGTRFNFGDGSPLFGSSIGPLLYLVTAVDTVNDWLVGIALDPASFPAIDTNISHTYATAGSYTASISTCCRVEASNGHVNNAGGDYRLQTTVNVGTGNRSPVSSMVPIVQCPINGACAFFVPGSDPDNDPIRFRLATASEAGSGFTNPGPPDAPNLAAINSSSGLYTWNTTGASLGSPTTLYSTQVIIEDLTGPGGTVKSKIPVDFFIQLVPQAGTAPSFNQPPSPVCGSTMTVNPFTLITFTVQASDADALQTVSLNASGLPAGATMTPGLPLSGNPVASVFSWTPTTAQSGQYAVTFSATDDAMLQTLCSITIDVTTCQINADCDDADACTTDTCNPSDPGSNAGGCVYGTVLCDDANVCTDDSCSSESGCSNTPNNGPCDDGLYCTVGEACSNLVCAGATPRDCSDSSVCTVDTCDEIADQCLNDAAPLEGTFCSDGLFCTTPDTCQSGVCAGSTRDCSDAFACTTDGCDEDANLCTHVVASNCCGNGAIESGEACDDGNSTNGDGCENDCTVSLTCGYVHPGTPNELFVGTCGLPTFATIQLAITAAQDGDIVSVCPGNYTQPVIIDKEITLRSTGGAAVTTLQTTGLAIDVRRSGVRIEGLTIVSGDTAIGAASICPLGLTTCSQPGAQGSNLTITDNVIHDSDVGIGWTGKIDCVAILDNVLTDNDRHIDLTQAAGPPPAVQVDITGNSITGGGTSGTAVSLSGIVVTFAANDVRNSALAGIEVGVAPVGTQLLENDIDANGGDGITIGPGGAATRVLNNNITNNGTGLGNEATSGTVDATLNWWGSQTGPGGAGGGVGDTVMNRSAATTTFIEFLCRPFPQGFPSLLGVCSSETPELRMLYAGTSPDVDPVGGFITFESTEDLDVDPRQPAGNADGSQEVFILTKTTKRSLGGVCLGGLAPGATCRNNLECPGDLFADPLVLNGDCIMLTQVTDDPSPTGVVSRPRVTSRGKNVVFYSGEDLTGGNGDGSMEVLRWKRKDFEKGVATPTLLVTASGVDSINPAPGLSARRVVVESSFNPVGQNNDGNFEIFTYDVKADLWTQLTSTAPPHDSRRPATGGSGRHVVFDSTGDLDNDPDTNASNADGNREIFRARTTGHGIVISQLTDTQSPVDNRIGGGLGKIFKIAVFSSNGDLVANGNTDGNREIFVWYDGQISQVTNSVAGVCETACMGDTDCLLECGNVNPVVDRFGRFIAFESTADLDNDGAANRRVYLYNRGEATLLRLSRSRFGENRVPRISNGRFVVWQSTADLTGGNPAGDRVIYMFDRRKDD